MSEVESPRAPHAVLDVASRRRKARKIAAILETERPLTGLQVLTVLCVTLAAGFSVSALGVISLTRIGYRLQALWCLLVGLTIVGIPYGLTVYMFLRRPSIQARFFA